MTHACFDLLLNYDNLGTCFADRPDRPLLRRDGPAACLRTSFLNNSPTTTDSKPTPKPSETVLVYPSDRPMEGVFTPLAAELMPIFEYDTLRVDERRSRRVHRIALQLRQAGKRIFHIRLARKGGRLLVALSGADPGRALRGIRVCRDHFDHWFGISASDIERFEASETESKS
jgi:hypothetical protein